MKLFITFFLLLTLRVEANECASDAKKFCQGTDPGKGQLAKCLSDYADQLSPNCAKELKKFKTDTAKKNPCFEDLAEYCADIPTDNRKLEYCLLKNESRLSATCSADFKKKKGNIIVKDVCAQDVANTCYKAVTEPEGAITRCLIKNKAKLAGHCKKKIEKTITEMKKKNPCFDDTEKFCPTQVRFMDIQECLEKKIPSLAPNCKKEVEEEVKKANANPCYRDLRRHCKPGLNANDQHRCLTVNEKELSNSCRQFRVKEDEKIQKMVKLCEPDRLKHCSKAPFQNGMVLKCLKENKAKLDPKCKELI